MTMISQVIGQEMTVVHKGKTYKLAPLSIEIMGAWKLFLIDRAYQAIDKIPMPADMKREQVAQLVKAVAAEEFGYFSETSMMALNNDFKSTARHMILLRIKANHSEANDDLIREIVEAKMAEIEAKMAIMDAPDPNSQAPQPGGEESPSGPSSQG